MHFKSLNKYYFINTLDTNNFGKQDKSTIIIYRNYASQKKDVNKILKLKNFLKKRGNKFFLANDFKLAQKLRLDGVYLPAFNKKFNHLCYSKMTNFDIIGSAHNLKEIRTKELQKVGVIFISSLFKKNKNFLGLNKFKILNNYTKNKVVALGGISKKNIKKIKILNITGIGGISFFKKKGP
jgi:thiamine-phosphate pyrophosphorylase